MTIPKHRFLIIADGDFGPLTSKTANSCIRYFPERIVAVFDRKQAGKTAQDVLGFGGNIPVVGDFGGPKAIRTIARYLKENGATVSAFYLSNVEQYLYQDRKWNEFCRNVATLPMDNSSTFIRSESGFGGNFGRFGSGFVSSLGQITSEIKACAGGK